MGRPMTDFTPGYLDRMIELTKKRPRELFALLTHLEPPPMTNVGWGVLRFVKEEKDARLYRIEGVAEENPDETHRFTRAQMAMLIEQGRLLAKARAGHKLTPDEIKFVKLMHEKVRRLIQ